MTTDLFIRSAKKVAIQELIRNEHAAPNTLDGSNIELVWYNHTLGNKKCLLYITNMSNLYVEVTHDSNKNSLYVDIYEQKSNTSYDVENILKSLK